MGSFRDVWEEYCEEDPSTEECYKEVHDYIQTAARDNKVRSSYDGEEVDLTIRDGSTEISARFGTRLTRHGSEVEYEGIAMVEDDDGEYLIMEDIFVTVEPFENDLPDVDRRDREAAEERRHKRREYQRSVL